MFPKKRVTLGDLGDKLLASIGKNPDDAVARAVFADWLEENNMPNTAELVRTQLAIATLDGNDDAGLARLGQRLREVAERTPAELRWILASAPIENCEIRFELQCPKRWDALTPTSRPGLRYCGACNKEVHYADSVREARRLALAGECVAVDITQPRQPGDLRNYPARIGLVAVSDKE